MTLTLYDLNWAMILTSLSLQRLNIGFLPKNTIYLGVFLNDLWVTFDL